MKLNPKKCRFHAPEVTYVGHVFTASGLKPDPQKTAVISGMSSPPDVPSLQRFLGMVKYLGKFIPDLSELSAPLRDLIKKDTAWAWFPQHQKAFDILKSKLISTPTLTFFDLQRPIIITCDASQFGLGAACLQLHDGLQLPVSFASHAMTPAEQHYAQIEKELLAVVFACSNFKDYLLGNTFTIETDYQSLVTIHNKSIHVASSRLQRMMLQLQRFTFEVVYRKGKDMIVADMLSRAPLTSTDRHPYEMSDLMVLNVNIVPSHQMKSLVQHTADDTALQTASCHHPVWLAQPSFRFAGWRPALLPGP